MNDPEWADDLHDYEDPDFEDPDFDDEFENEPVDLINCPVCHGEIYEDAEQCPLCGNYITATTAVHWLWWWTAAVLLACLVLGFLMTCRQLPP